MKKILFLLTFLFALAVGAQAQTNCVELREIDGTPDVKCVKIIKVTNGTLACTGNTCTITISGGGGGSPGGADTNVQYNDSGSFGGVAGFVFDKTSKISLGVAGTSVGAVAFRNATSGTITVQPVTGALGTVTLSLPAVTDTLVGLAATQTLINKTLTTPTIGDFSNANHNHSNSAGGGQIAISSGISGLGTGVATALGTNVGSAGAFVTFNGAGGTPSSLTLTNATGLPPTTGISGWPANAAGVLTNNGSGTLSWAAAGGGITIGTTTITSGTNTKVLFNNSGVVGEYTITGTGNVAMSASPTFTGTVAAAALTASSTITQTSTSATAFTSGANGATNPTLTIDNSTASQVSGITVAGKADGTAPTITVNSRTQQTNAIAGNGLAIIADPAIAGSSSGTAAAGGSVTITAGAAARNTSGNANGGNITLTRGAGIGTGTTGQVLLAGGDGAVATPALANSGSTNTGIYFPGTNQVGISANGTQTAQFSSTTFAVIVGQFSLGANNVFITAPAANSIQWGLADAASPSNRTTRYQSVSSGTSNTAGATASEIASLGTGNAAPGRTHFQGGALSATSGTTQQTAIDRLVLGATKVLTNNSATTITNATAASNTIAGGVLDYLIEVFDGTDLQTEVGSVSYTLVNKGGAFSGNTMTKFGNSQTATSGTLTVTFAISAANPGVISVNANSSLTPSTGYPRITYMPRNLSQNAISIQ